MSVFLGDGSFEDCVQLAFYAETCKARVDRGLEVDREYLEVDYFPVLSNTSVPVVVVDYVGSVVDMFDTRFFNWCSLSDVVIAERLKKNHVRNEILSWGLASSFSECFERFGTRFVQYKFFELPSSEHRIHRDNEYAQHQLRIAHSWEIGVGLDVFVFDF